MKKENVPKFTDLLESTYNAIKELGGSAKNDEIIKQIILDLQLPDEIVDIIHPGTTSRTELDYQVAWAKNYLKNYGAIESSARSVWTITKDFYNVSNIKKEDVLNKIKSKKRKTVSNNVEFNNPEDDDPNNNAVEYPEEVKPWREQISEILKNMDPYAFERLIPRILRECGFTDLVVTKKSGDGGIDGTGKLRINGIFSFNVGFQCKRYNGAVGAPEVRDFRGSLTTAIEKGVLITTGTFTSQAKEEASNPGKQQIDLMDGEDLIDKIIEFGIGVKEVTSYEVDESYFESI